MLRIRQEQVHIFGASDRRAFSERLVPYLAEVHPAWFEARSPESAQQFVLRAIEQGAQHGIRSRHAVLTFVELLIEFGEGFKKSPDRAWAQGILSHPTLPDGLKLDILSERLRALTGGRTIVEFER